MDDYNIDPMVRSLMQPRKGHQPTLGLGLCSGHLSTTASWGWVDPGGGGGGGGGDS